MTTLYFATNNPNKLKEVREKVGDGIEIKPLSDLNFSEDIPETRDTLEGNALQKAEFIHERFKVNCFADDTGLEVSALDGRPGVYSARYAGPECSADNNIEKLLGELEDKNDRSAKFRTVIALILDGKKHTFEGEVNGEILEARTGDAGFGYDPVFKPKGYEVSFAEMPMELKNQISHRALAVEKLVDFLNSLP